MSTPAQSSSPSPDRATWHLPQLEHWIIVPLIVVLAIGAIGRIVSLTPEVGAAESQVLAALDPVRSGLLLAVAGFVHGIFSAPWVYGIIAALTAWLALVKRSGRDAAGFAVTAVTMVVVASTAQQIIGRPAPGLGDGVLTAEVGSSLPSAAVCAAIGISLAFLVASRRHISGMAVLLAGAGVSLVVALSALLTSSAYVLDVVLSLPVAWAGVVLGCGLANRVVPAMAERFGWGLPRADRKLAHRQAPRYSDAETAYARSESRSTAAASAHRDLDDGPITEELPVIREDDAAAA
ncbi:MAG: hypothetical protein DI634_10000 [Kocuria palustris]|nr:MAG: hypothetical protein DI634_10000 [Kocuria palustris]